MPVREANPKTKEPATLLEFSLAADPKFVPEARFRAMQVCTEVGIPEDHCFELDLALGEALANAVLHGAPQGSNRKKNTAAIRLTVWRYDRALIVQVQDRGPGFHPPLPPYPMPDPTAGTTHGRGLPLMETLTDAMLACPGDITEGGASIYLVKSVPQG